MEHVLCPMFHVLRGEEDETDNALVIFCCWSGIFSYKDLCTYMDGKEIIS